MPSEEEDYLNNEYYAYNLRLFRLIGLWDYQRSSMKFIYVCFINLIITLAAFEQIYTAVTSERDLNSIAKLLETILPTLCFGSCYCNLLSNGAILKKILYRMHCDWDEMAGKPELAILKKYAKLSRLCTVVIMVSLYLYIVFLMFPSILRIIQYNFGIISYDDIILPVRFDHYMKNHKSYYLGFCHQCLSISITCTIGVANYSMFVSIILHACALFNVIVWRINERFKENPNDNHFDSEDIKLANENEWIVGIIQVYKNPLEFIDLIKLFYEITHLFEWFLAVFFIMVDYFYLFQVLSPNLSMSEILTKLSYVVASMFVIVSYVHLGQKLIDHNNNVFLSLCQIPFYSLSLRSQKTLLFFTMETMRLRNLSCKGVIVVCHYTLSMVMQKSFSFAMVFYNLQ